MMPVKSLPPVLLVAVLFSASACVADESEIRGVVDRSLPYLEKEGVAWMNKRGCVSCHQIPFMVWSLTAASEAGFDVDREKLQQWQEWSTDVVNFVKPEQKKDVDREKTMAANIDTMAAMLLALNDDPTSEWRQAFAAGLATNQKDDGSWKSCGQLPAQKRPAAETTSVTAAWTLLALKSQRQDEFDVDGALNTIDATTSAKSTEWWVARLLLAAQMNDEREAELRDALLERQNDDGGWGWITGQQSDALATGMAVYALGVTGDEIDTQTSVALATRFLIDTQQDDGSWKVPGTKKSTQKKTTPTSSYWGTAWAVIGLLEAGPEAATVAGT